MSNIKTVSELDFGVGDIITAHHAGFHRVVEIVPRYATLEDVKHFTYANININVGDEYSPTIRYVTLFNSKYAPVQSKKVSECDAAYCALLSIEQLDNIIARIDNIKQIVNEKREV